MTAPSQRFELFSLTHAQAMDGTQSFLEATLATSVGDDLDILGVNSATVTPNSGNWSNEGDDANMSEWNWLTDADIAIQGGYFSFPLIARITGQPVQSSTLTGGRRMFGIDLWHESSMNVPPFPLLVRTACRDEDGLIYDATIGLYKFQPAPFSFNGPEYKGGVKVNYNGKALLSRKDEKGVVFADGKKRIGRLLTVSA